MTAAYDPRLLTAGRSVRPQLATSVTVAVAATGIVLAQATLIAAVIARVSAGASYAAVRGLLIALLAVVVARAGLLYAGEVTALRAAATVKSQLRRRLVAQALALGPGWLAGPRTRELTTLATRGLDALDPYFSRYLPQLLLAVLLPVMVLVRVAWADWPSAVIIAITLPLIPLFMVLIGAHTRERTDRQWQLLSRLGGHFLDVVSGLPTLVVFNRAKGQADVIRDVTDAHRRQTLSSLRVAFLSALVLELLATLAMALVAVEVGLRLLRGGLPYETALLVLLLTPEAYLPLRQLGVHYHASMEGVAAARAAFDVIDSPTPASISEPRSGLRADLRRDRVSLDDVTVCFDDRTTPALDHVSLSLDPGEHVLVTGPSGAGKSTLLAVLLRFVTPTTGSFSVCGLPFERFDIDDWRAQVAWLPQRPHLFAGTIADNIALGAPDASRDAVRRAAAVAGADTFVSALPDAYDTVLPERALTLSTGERQRIALARVLLRDAPLVLLDEPTAHLDAASADAVRAAVAALMGDRTVVWLSHAPVPSEAVHRVVHLDHGRVQTQDVTVAS